MGLSLSMGWVVLLDLWIMDGMGWGLCWDLEGVYLGTGERWGWEIGNKVSVRWDDGLGERRLEGSV